MLSKILVRAIIIGMGVLPLSQALKADSTSVTQAFKTQRNRVSAYRPNDWVHLYYAVQVYKDSGGRVLPGWKLVRTCSEKNGYFGAVYRNMVNKHIIIAHRGTQDLKDWLSNLDLITRHLNEQEASAWYGFSKKIIEEYGPTYTYSFTGHSLGGWLAQTCLWKYQDEFVQGKTPFYQDGFAVTLDDPGAEELLEALQPRVETNYKISVEKLDITSYLSRPNVVNTAMGHAGTAYALFPGINLSWLEKNTLKYTFKAHEKQLLLDEFSSETGLPNKCMRVISWPRVKWGTTLSSSNERKGVFGYLALMLKAYITGEIKRGEYTGFFTYSANVVDHPEQLSPASRFQLQHGIHYDVREFDKRVLPLRNMPFSMQRFLEELSEEKNRVKIINEVLSITIDPEIAHLLTIYRINERRELVLEDPNKKINLRYFRDKLLNFLSINPILYQIKLSVLQTDLIFKRLQTRTDAVPVVLTDLYQQLEKTRDLIYHLNFTQGTARLYKFIKPTWEEVERIRDELHALNSQLAILQSFSINLCNISLSNETRSEVLAIIETQKKQLAIAKQGSNAFLKYLEENYSQADSQIDELITTVADSKLYLPELNKELLLNRAYNFKATIANLMGRKELSVKYYQKALELLPTDPITLSNYGGLLTNFGREDPSFCIEAYRHYQRLYPRLEQINFELLPVVRSGMAYGLILLALNIEKKSLDSTKANLPSVKELRCQARDLLKRAVHDKPDYLNARLFLAILSYDEGDYLVALQEVNNALSIQPEHPTALKRKGYILAKLGEIEEALEFLGRAKQSLQATQKNGENEDHIKEIDKKVIEIESIKRRQHNEGVSEKEIVLKKVYYFG